MRRNFLNLEMHSRNVSFRNRAEDCRIRVGGIMNEPRQPALQVPARAFLTRTLIGRSPIVAASTRVSRGAVVEKNEWTLVRRIGRRIVLTGLVRQWVAAWTATATGRS